MSQFDSSVQRSQELALQSMQSQVQLRVRNPNDRIRLYLPGGESGHIQKYTWYLSLQLEYTVTPIDIIRLVLDNQDNLQGLLYNTKSQ